MSEYSKTIAGLTIPASTTWVWRKCILAESSAPAGDAVRAKRDPFAFRARDRYKPLDANVRFRGGPEASITVTARGKTWRFPGHVALIDVVNLINGG